MNSTFNNSMTVNYLSKQTVESKQHSTIIISEHFTDKPYKDGWLVIPII